jgi:pilus assembly protein Flp/PilA
MKDMLIKFWKDEEGATAVEYGLIAALIAAVIAVTVGELGTALDGIFSDIKTAIAGT